MKEDESIQVFFNYVNNIVNNMLEDTIRDEKPNLITWWLP